MKLKKRNKKCKVCKGETFGGKWLRFGDNDKEGHYFCGITCFEKFHKIKNKVK